MQYFNKNKEKMRKKFNFVKFFNIDFSFFLLLFFALMLDDFGMYCWHVIFVLLHEITHLLVSKKLGYLPQKIHITFWIIIRKLYMIFWIRGYIEQKNVTKNGTLKSTTKP